MQRSNLQVSQPSSFYVEEKVPFEAQMRVISRKFLRFAICAALIIGSLVACWLSASLRGQIAARIDVARGDYTLLVYGLPVEWENEDARILQQRYGVRMKAVAGCIVSESLVNYVGAYDRYVTAAANQKFGHDIFKESSEEAERNWRLKSAQYPQQK
jgi:hypothetical protein